MKQFIVGGLATAVTAGALIASAPPASAGCQYGGIAISKCDGAVQPDGTWQRCVTFPPTGSGLNGSSSYLTDKNCQTLGPDQHPWGFAFVDPPTHIDD
jgi:hypothetical protein